MPTTRARRFPLLAALALLAAALPARAQLQADNLEFRGLYKELVEINTSATSGSCTPAAEAMGARLKAAGLPAQDVQVLVPADAPKKGNLVARLRGTGAKKPVLLLAHIDVVEAHRADWERDPFKLVEENGYFYARGAADDKSMAAAFVYNVMRYHREGFRPERDLILALTCDEEIIPSEHNGVEFLLKHHRSLIDAEFALNEGGSGLIDRNGKYLYLGVQAGEKVFQTYYLETTNPGGHSSRPSKDNAIYHLADALSKLARFDFPFRLNEVTRGYFAKAATLESGGLGPAMKGILSDPPDAKSLAAITASPAMNTLVRTTCVATMLFAGHATNALPQRARAVVNCRILPGEPVEGVQQALAKLIDNPKIRITPAGEPVLSPAPPLAPAIMQPIEAVAGQMWPGVPIVPTMLAGATDGRFLNNAGIPTYGVSGMFRDIDGGGVHGLNERIRTKSLFEGVEFLYRLVKRYAGGQ